MDALFLPFLAALLAEFGDRTQILAMLLAARFGAGRTVFAGVALAALANSAIAALAGRAIRAATGPNLAALTLMLALALLSAGAGAMRQKPPEAPARARGGVVFASFFAAFVLGFGDKTMFLTMTLAARSGSIVLPAIGAAAGMILAAAPAILLGERLPRVLPLKPIRIGIGALLLLLGFAAAVAALGLV